MSSIRSFNKIRGFSDSDVIYASAIEIDADTVIHIGIIREWDSYIEDGYNMVAEVKERDLPPPVLETLTQYNDWAIDNYTKSFYFKVDFSYSASYFVIEESLIATRDSYLAFAAEKGETLTKHEAWLKAIKTNLATKQWLQDYYNDEWFFVGISAIIEKKNTIAGKVTSIDLWGIEWLSYLEDSKGNNQAIFKEIVPDLLEGEITLTPEQVHELWLDLDC